MRRGRGAALAHLEDHSPDSPGQTRSWAPPRLAPGPLPCLHPLLHSRQGTPLRTLRSQETGSHPSPSQEHLGHVLSVGEGTLCRGPAPQTADRTGVLPLESSALRGRERAGPSVTRPGGSAPSPPRQDWGAGGRGGGVQAKTRLQAKSLSSASNALCSQLTSVEVVKLPSQSLRPS